MSVDVLVVGGGQAGLAAARALGAAELDCRVYERRPRIGDCWRARFDSLVLFTSRAVSALPDLPHDGDGCGFPTKDEMGDYLERYAGHFRLPIVTGNGIERLRREGPLFAAATDRGERVLARAVVITTGTFQRPSVPSFAGRLAAAVQQLDAQSYRNPSSVAGANVVVVGDGATGRQIARELAGERRVVLAMGRHRNFGPQRILGRDTTWWALRAGLLAAEEASIRGRLVRKLDATPGLHLRPAALLHAGVELAPRCVAADGDVLAFADGSRRRCDAVIWTLGYRDDTSWVDIPGAVGADTFVHERGAAPVAGLFYVGREWQTCRASGLICGVGRDAASIATRVREHLAER
ncbi:MAG TPA: NAD(P)/FAD-dependent oxidoreductase [Gammaproteobacteria bacterium]